MNRLTKCLSIVRFVSKRFVENYRCFSPFDGHNWNGNKVMYFSTASGNHINLAYNSYENIAINSNADTSIAPIVIMHGLFGSKQNWKSLSKALHAKTVPTRKVIALDARNHGESPHSPNHSYEDLAQDIYEFYRQNNIKKSIIIGHSMGGRAMMCLALKYPELVEKAIIVDISPINQSPSLTSMGALFEAMTKVTVPSTLKMSEGRTVADEQLKQTVGDKVTRDFILMNLMKADDGCFSWRINVDALHKNFEKYIVTFPEELIRQKKQFMGPTLFIGGSESNYLRPTELPELQQLFPNSQLKFLKCGHLVHVEQPHEFLKLVVEFVNAP